MVLLVSCRKVRSSERSKFKCREQFRRVGGPKRVGPCSKQQPTRSCLPDLGGQEGRRYQRPRGQDLFDAVSASKSLYLVPALHSVFPAPRPHPSYRRRIASARICTALLPTRPLLPPFSSTPTNTAATTSSSITCCPASTSAAPITLPPSHHSPVAVPTVYTACT